MLASLGIWQMIHEGWLVARFLIEIRIDWLEQNRQKVSQTNGAGIREKNRK